MPDLMLTQLIRQNHSSAGASHHPEGFGRTRLSDSQFVFAAVLLICVRWWRGLVEDTYGPVLSNPVGHFIRVDPHGEFTWKQWKESLFCESDRTGRFAYQRVHLMVDPDAPVTRTSARCVWEPMVLIMIYNERTKLGLGTIKHVALLAKVFGLGALRQIGG